MNARTYQYLKASILLGTGLFLFYKIVSGTLYFYINQRFLWLSVLGGLAFLVLAWHAWPQRKAADEHVEHEGHEHAEGNHWTLFVLAIPLVLGFLVPAKPLDSSALQSRGLTTNALLATGSKTVQLDQPSDQRTVLDWVRAFNFASDPSTYDGDSADVIGFVYHDDRLPDNQLLVGRFAITCCVADAFAVGVIVQSDDAQQWAGNTWVHVAGKIRVGTLEDAAVPLIIASSIKEVPVPPQPYLFP